MSLSSLFKFLGSHSCPIRPSKDGLIMGTEGQRWRKLCVAEASVGIDKGVISMTVTRT